MRQFISVVQKEIGVQMSKKEKNNDQMRPAFPNRLFLFNCASSTFTLLSWAGPCVTVNLTGYTVICDSRGCYGNVVGVGGWGQGARGEGGLNP